MPQTYSIYNQINVHHLNILQTYNGLLLAIFIEPDECDEKRDDGPETRHCIVVTNKGNNKIVM